MGFEIPIVHVNADDPEACLQSARPAFAYRTKFQKDFLIDLIGYRRYGHNEGDEPRFPQPLMYEKIERHRTVRELWATTMMTRGLIDGGWPKKLMQNRMQALQRVLESLPPEVDLVEPQPKAPAPGAARRVQTAGPARRVREARGSPLRGAEGFT